jgi:hypothetical protein
VRAKRPVRAGEFVREEIHHVRKGKHGTRSTKQAIAIGCRSSAGRRRTALAESQNSEQGHHKTSSTRLGPRPFDN